MSRTLSVVLLVLTSLLIQPSKAYATDWWGWLEEFSGPGPFRGGSIGATFCFQDGDLQGSPLISKATSEPNGWKKCLHVDRGKFGADADADQGFPKIDVTLWEFGGGIRFKDWFDFGMSAGVMAFDTDDTRFRPVFTPVRAVVRPISLVVPEDKRQKWHNIVNIYYKAPWVFGELTGRHFGAPPEAFSSNGEFVQSAGLLLDLGALF